MGWRDLDNYGPPGRRVMKEKSRPDIGRRELVALRFTTRLVNHHFQNHWSGASLGRLSAVVSNFGAADELVIRA